MHMMTARVVSEWAGEWVGKDKRMGGWLWRLAMAAEGCCFYGAVCVLQETNARTRGEYEKHTHSHYLSLIIHWIFLSLYYYYYYY
jgi:hypothetical protein